MLFGIFKNGYTLRSLQRQAGMLEAVGHDYELRIKALAERGTAAIADLNTKLDDAVEQALADRYAVIAQLRQEIDEIATI